MREYCLVGYWTQVGRGYYALGHGQGEFVIKVARFHLAVVGW